MTNLSPSMRLKVKRDTYFLPDANGSVYFRNNSGSFRMEGSAINQWVEKLMPMFDGEYSLENLTEGLPGPYRNRVFEIAEVLYQNGFVNDVSKDHPHQLSEHVLKTYASQIAFLESFVDSSAYRFQIYRQEKVLAIGSGPLFLSLVSSLMESGLANFHILLTNAVHTNRKRLAELAVHARKTDPEIAIEVHSLKNLEDPACRELVQSFDSVMYVAQDGGLEELKTLHDICREEKKRFIPAVCFEGVGMAGPIVDPDSVGCWESAWRSLHGTVFEKGEQPSFYSSTAGAMLANVTVFEMFKMLTGVSEPNQQNRFFLLDLETLEGKWHKYMPHPLVTNRRSTRWIDIEEEKNKGLEKVDQNGLFLSFSQLTSKNAGVFHTWEEGDLKQLPLTQCEIQVVDPGSDGPAELLPAAVCSAMTHNEARREAGLTGIEMYTSAMIADVVSTLPEHPIVMKENVGVGAGETLSEAICRGLQSCLSQELRQKAVDGIHVTKIQLNAIEDTDCRFYRQVLPSEPTFALGEEVSGFPVVWVNTNNRWYGCAGMNQTMALRHALKQAVMDVQNKESYSHPYVLKSAKVGLEKDQERQNIDIPACEDYEKQLHSAMHILAQNHLKLCAFEIKMDPFLNEENIRLSGVLLREEGSS